MAKKDTWVKPGPPTNVSARALSIGRTIDRLCRLPGTYAITVTVPEHKRAPWLVQIHRLDTMRRFELNR